MESTWLMCLLLNLNCTMECNTQCISIYLLILEPTKYYLINWVDELFLLIEFHLIQHINLITGCPNWTEQSQTKVIQHLLQFTHCHVILHCHMKVLQVLFNPTHIPYILHKHTYHLNIVSDILIQWTILIPKLICHKFLIELHYQWHDYIL